MKKIKRISIILINVLIITLFTNYADAASKEVKSTAKNNASVMREITTMELVKDMKLGINLGNTFEACGDWISKTSGISAYEKAWGSPIVTEKMIKGYAQEGFKTVRVPVAWSNLMAEDYTINSELFDRVETVVKYIIDNGMYAIVNIHWDNGWWKKFTTDYDECMKKYKSVWTQISKRFKNYSDYLIFESLNEEGSFDDVWNRYSGSNDGKDKAYGILNKINQQFVNTVRASGGNNKYRHLLIAGYATDIELTCDPSFKMPKDVQNRCAVSMHYYTPSTFAILDEDASWGKARKSWGTEKDFKELNRLMDLVKKTFVDKGIPVIIGEFGSTTKNKEEGAVNLYLTSVCEAIYSRGMCPVLWDITNVFYDRTKYKMIDSELKKNFKAIVSKKR